MSLMTQRVTRDTSTRLAEIIRDSGVPADTVAGVAGISRSSLFRAFRGDGSLRLDQWERIANHLGVDPAELWSPAQSESAA